MQSSPAQTKNNQNHNKPQTILSNVSPHLQLPKQHILFPFETSHQDPHKDHPKLSFPNTQKQTFEKQTFAPFITNTLQFKTDVDLRFGNEFYNEKQNLIVALHMNGTGVQFYNATTLLPSNQTKIDGTQIFVMAFDAETEVYLFGCSDGLVYSYNIGDKIPQVLAGPAKPSQLIRALTFINSDYFAFSAFGARCLYIGNVRNGDIWTCYSRFSDSTCLYSLTNYPLLLSYFTNNSLVLYRTNHLPKLRTISSVKAISIHQILSVTISQKEYIITTGKDCRIWHLIKGKMRLLRVINMEDKISHMVYLENYNMLAMMIHSTNEIKFVRFLSGKLEETLDLPSEFHGTNLFFTREKNAIGVVGNYKDKIQIVQLHRKEIN